MKKQLILLLGLLALALLAWLCLGRHVPAIEKDLVSRTADGLNAAGLNWSRVSISGRDISLTGTAPSAELKERAGDVASSIYGVRAVNNRITVEQEIAVPPSPYEMSFLLEDGEVVISGMVPDEDVRQAVIKEAVKRLGEDRVRDRLQVNSGAPAGWRSAALDIADSLDRFSRMSATMVETEIRVSGVVDSDDIRRELERSLSAALPREYSHRFEIVSPAEPRSLPDAAVNCQRRFDELLAARSIHFDTSSAHISRGSFALLDELALAASECPEARIRIEGHTDSRGGEGFNKRLSQARAESVVRYLIEKGVAASRLTAVGYGESRPVADNATAAGQARNRRIEFNVNLQGN